MATLANLALEGGDPRDVAHPVTALHGGESAETTVLRQIHDPSVTFEEYSTLALFHFIHLITPCYCSPNSISRLAPHDADPP